ncbi:hypothetical protein JCM6882_004367 [Rhodosporidiobolus microsporus]
MSTAPHLDFPLEPAGYDLLRRSRTGCLTCRKRKKKCPEQYDQNGDCTRCKDGGWRCVKPDPDAPAIRRAKTSGGKVKGGGGTASVQLERVPRSPKQSVAPTSLPASNIAFHAEAGPSSTMSSSNLDPSTDFNNFLGASDFSQLPELPLSTPHLAMPSLPTPPGLNSAPYPSYLAQFAPELDLTAFLGQLDSSPTAPPVVPLAPPILPSFAPQEHGRTEVGPSYPAPFGSVEGAPAEGGTSDSFASASPTSGVSSSFSTASSRGREGAGFAAALASETPFKTLLATAMPTRADKDALLLRFYCEHVIPAWSVTYPPQTRSQQVTKCLDITPKYAITRQASRLAAAAYIKLYQQTGWLASAFTHGPTVELAPEFERLDVDPTAMFDETMRMLTNSQDVGVTLEAQLWALSDIHIALGAIGTAPQSHEIAGFGDMLLQHAFGPQPHINLAALSEYSSFAVHAFAMIDFNRSLARRTPTCLRFELGHAEDTDADSGAHEIWFGLPASLAHPLIEVANLCAAAQAARDRGLALPEHEALANELIARLQSWRPRFSVFDDGDRHSISFAAELTVQQENWRYTGLLLLHRDVLRRTPLHKDLAPIITTLVGGLKAITILSQARRNQQPALIDWWSAMYTTTAFLVGSIAIGDDRQFCRRFISSAGREPALAAMVKVMEATWEASDAQGGFAEWFEVAKERRIELVFF